MCVRDIDFASIYDLAIGYWNCSDSVIFFVFLDFVTILTVWYFLKKCRGQTSFSEIKRSCKWFLHVIKMLILTYNRANSVISKNTRSLNLEIITYNRANTVTTKNTRSLNLEMIMHNIFNLQELPTIPEHLSSPPGFSGVRVTRSLVLYVCFVDRSLSFCTFSFGHCVVCSSSRYGFWLPLW
jgi:hypothetical protein